MSEYQITATLQPKTHLHVNVLGVILMLGKLSFMSTTIEKYDICLLFIYYLFPYTQFLSTRVQLV